MKWTRDGDQWVAIVGPEEYRISLLNGYTWKSYHVTVERADTGNKRHGIGSYRTLTLAKTAAHTRHARIALDNLNMAGNTTQAK